MLELVNENKNVTNFISFILCFIEVGHRGEHCKNSEYIAEDRRILYENRSQNIRK